LGNDKLDLDRGKKEKKKVVDELATPIATGI
jgi:hypothetical protein